MQENSIIRRKSKVIYVGNIPIGGDNPIVIQSMTNTDTRDVASTVQQINQLAEQGCQIVRLAVPDEQAATAIRSIKSQVSIPLIADIHFNHELALQAIKGGIDGLRINPGNIGRREHAREVILACQEKNIPIRIGVNAGSLEKRLLEKYGGVTAQAMVESALEHVDLLHTLNYHNIKLSMKASNVVLTIQAYQLLAQQVEYPFHIGITEAGTVASGTIKSAVGIGALLAMGLGDTVRVSLTGSPLAEIPVAKRILQSLNLYHELPELISCPTCGRCEIDLNHIATQVESRLLNVRQPIKVAVMGCIVNGPGEAREADIGIAGGKGVGLIFKKGEILKKVPESLLVDELLNEIDNWNK